MIFTPIFTTGDRIRTNSINLQHHGDHLHHTIVVNGPLEPDIPRPEKRSAGDIFFMDAIESHVNTEEKAAINTCCTFFNVITVADIATFDGTKIRYEVLSTEHLSAIVTEDTPQEPRSTPMFTPLNKYNWPRSPQTLTHKEWQAWKQALQILSADSNGTLRHPIGQIPQHQAQHWKWRYSPLKR